ncbi:DUF6471 domain-containing protein [Shinella sp.]|uniref:DUF6471 domain-containing protein n=1 Tax=Shinella sp. TaxID=1870904 RepID=UPI003F72433A
MRIEASWIEARKVWSRLSYREFEKRRSIFRNKLSRGRFTAVFLDQCLVALNSKIMTLPETPLASPKRTAE